MNAPLRSQHSTGFTLKHNNNNDNDVWREKQPDMMNVDTPKYMNAPSSELAKSKLSFSFGNMQPIKQEWSLTKSPFVLRAPVPTVKHVIPNSLKHKASPIDEGLIRRGMVQVM